VFVIEQHTADVRLRLRGRTLEDLFTDGARALAAVMQPVPTPDVREYTFRFDIDSVDTTSVLIDFLSDVLLRMHIDRARIDTVAFDRVDPLHVTGELRGIAPVEFGEDVKAVTYHEAEVVQNATGEWETGIVLDL
jgi:SHS2 domain-containing protein